MSDESQSIPIFGEIDPVPVLSDDALAAIADFLIDLAESDLAKQEKPSP